MTRRQRDDAINEPQHLVVVAAVIERDDRFLLTLRPAGVHLAHRWEFPGGKCEAHESHAEALRRELHEELDIVATVGALVHAVTHSYPDRTVELHFYACDFQGTAKGMVGQEVRWVRRHELASLPLPEADAALIAQLSTDSRRGPAGNRPIIPLPPESKDDDR